jgi:hypothetical protein
VNHFTDETSILPIGSQCTDSRNVFEVFWTRFALAWLDRVASAIMRRIQDSTADRQQERGKGETGLESFRDTWGASTRG